MTKMEHEQLVEKALREYALEQKREKDEETVRVHEQTLNKTVKNYRFTTSAYTTGGKKNRALAIGGCILEAAEKLEKESLNHKFMPGSLGWNITEEHVKDQSGNKGYKCEVSVIVATDEKAFTDEEIKEKVEDLRKRLEAETNEMFMEESEQDPAEEQPAVVNDTSIQ